MLCLRKKEARATAHIALMMVGKATRHGSNGYLLPWAANAAVCCYVPQWPLPWTSSHVVIIINTALVYVLLLISSACRAAMATAQCRPDGICTSSKCGRVSSYNSIWLIDFWTCRLRQGKRSQLKVNKVRQLLSENHVCTSNVCCACRQNNWAAEDAMQRKESEMHFMCARNRVKVQRLAPEHCISDAQIGAHNVKSALE